MVNFTTSIEKLNNNNYGSWSTRIKFYLLGQDLWDIVNGSETTPPRDISTSTSTPPALDVTPQKATTNTDAIKKWKVKVGKAMHALIVAVEDEFLQ